MKPEISLPQLDMFPRYAELGASSRLRFYQYAAKWAAEGGTVAVHPFFGSDYLSALYRTGRKSPSALTGGWFRRLEELKKAGHNLLIEYELFPFLPFIFEYSFLKRRSFILNFDDAVYLKYSGIPFLRNKYDRLIKNASGVICANDLLLEWARRLNNNVIKLPTVVNLASYRKVVPEKFSRLTVVWIGSPATYNYLLNAHEHLLAMRAVADFELLVIGGEPLPEHPLSGIDVRYEKWSESTEIELLKSSHIGIMPLPEHDRFARGKSAFKLIQYCAAEIPAIASDVGENRNVLADGITGFLANTPADWAAAFRELTSLHLRKEFSHNCRDRAEEFSLEHYYPQFREFILRTFASSDCKGINL